MNFAFSTVETAALAEREGRYSEATVGFVRGATLFRAQLDSVDERTRALLLSLRRGPALAISGGE